jgi:broad specificity phosphatase PhoE
MIVRLTMVCHGVTKAIRDVAFPMDEPLDPSGEARARALASSFRRVDAAWTSPALRAQQTAAALGLDAVADPALRDIDLGHWAGRPFDEVSTTEPDAVIAWITDPAAAPHGGESVAALLERIRPWLAAQRTRHGRFVAVSHQAVIRAAVLIALDANPAAFWRIDAAPLCRVRLSGNASGWTLQSIG